MNIKTLLEADLWNVIEKNYTNENFTGAIDDAVFHIRDVIREKSNLEQDGKDLINQAFSEKNPKIKLNKLRTKHDKNIQNGVRDSLLGVWGLIRNTRNHEKHVDTVEDAFSIILHINYLLKIIDKAKSAFSTKLFIEQVYDEHFVQTTQYAELLVNEVPHKQIEDTFFQLYQSIKNNVYEYSIYDGELDSSFELKDNHRKLTSLKLVFFELLKKLGDDKNEILHKVVSDLNTLEVDNEFYWKLSLVVKEWKTFDLKTQLRIRNILQKYTKDFDHAYYKNQIFLDGWKYFDDATKEVLYAKFMQNDTEYEIVDDELIYIGHNISIDKVDNKVMDAIPF